MTAGCALVRFFTMASMTMSEIVDFSVTTFDLRNTVWSNSSCSFAVSLTFAFFLGFWDLRTFGALGAGDCSGLAGGAFLFLPALDAEGRGTYSSSPPLLPSSESADLCPFFPPRNIPEIKAALEPLDFALELLG